MNNSKGYLSPFLLPFLLLFILTFTTSVSAFIEHIKSLETQKDLITLENLLNLGIEEYKSEMSAFNSTGTSTYTYYYPHGFVEVIQTQTSTNYITVSYRAYSYDGASKVINVLSKIESNL